MLGPSMASRLKTIAATMGKQKHLVISHALDYAPEKRRPMLETWTETHTGLCHDTWLASDA